MGNITSLTPAEIISLHQGRPITTSLKVAEVFGKQHKDVLRKIATLDCSKNSTSAILRSLPIKMGKVRSGQRMR